MAIGRFPLITKTIDGVETTIGTLYNTILDGTKNYSNAGAELNEKNGP